MMRYETFRKKEAIKGMAMHPAVALRALWQSAFRNERPETIGTYEKYARISAFMEENGFSRSEKREVWKQLSKKEVRNVILVCGDTLGGFSALMAVTSFMYLDGATTPERRGVIRGWIIRAKASEEQPKRIDPSEREYVTGLTGYWAMALIKGVAGAVVSREGVLKQLAAIFGGKEFGIRG